MAAIAALAALALGLAFAGSPKRLADGVRIAGVEVGGKTPRQAQRALEARAGALAAVPVTFRVGSHVWRLEPRRLGVRVDWDAAVDAVRRQGEGFGPLRGFRRLDMRFFGADVAPPTQVYDAALRYWLDRIERTVDVPVGANRENNVRSGFSRPLRPSWPLAWQCAIHPGWFFGMFMKTLLTDGMPHFENMGHRTALITRKGERDRGRRDQMSWKEVEMMRKGGFEIEGAWALVLPLLASDVKELWPNGNVVVRVIVEPLAALRKVQVPDRR